MEEGQITERQTTEGQITEGQITIFYDGIVIKDTESEIIEEVRLVV